MAELYDAVTMDSKMVNSGLCETSDIKLSSTAQQSLVGQLNTRWRTSTEQTSKLRENSRLGWQFYLDNQPSNTRHSRQATSSTVESGTTPKAGFQGQGLRFGDIPRSVDAISAFLHNSLFSGR